MPITNKIGAPIKDRTGVKFGRWTVLFRTEQKQRRHYLWMCECKCGTKRPVLIHSLVTGKSQSCGCLKAETAGNLWRTHGLSNSRVYRIWENMKARCYRTTDPKTFRLYRGKGIKVCEQWLNSFENFYAYMGNPLSEIHSIDRMDGNKDYEPGNCRWATPSEQGKNWSK